MDVDVILEKGNVCDVLTWQKPGHEFPTTLAYSFLVKQIRDLIFIFSSKTSNVRNLHIYSLYIVIVEASVTMIGEVPREVLIEWRGVVVWLWQEFFGIF